MGFGFFLKKNFTDKQTAATEKRKFLLATACRDKKTRDGSSVIEMT